MAAKIIRISWLFLKSWRNISSSLKSGIKRNQITVINASVTVLLIGIVIFVLLSRASALQRGTAEEAVINLAGQTAIEARAYFISNSDLTRTMSQIINNYQTIEVERRREFLNNAMMGLISANRALVNIYTVWKPDALDGMDAHFANSEDSSSFAGQFMSGYTIENGWLEQKSFEDFAYVLDLDYISSGDGISNQIISEPMLKIADYREFWVVEVQIPIFTLTRLNPIPQEEDLVGVIGTTIDLDSLQYLIGARRPFGTGRTMVCSSEGAIIAYTNPQLRGFKLHDPEQEFIATNAEWRGFKIDDPEQEFISNSLLLEDPLLSGEISVQVFQAMRNSIQSMSPTVLRTSDMLVISYPFRMLSSSAFDINSGPSWAIITAVPMSVIMEPVNNLLRFSIVFIIGAAVVMVFVVLGTSSSLTQRARTLQRELEHASTMQDNLKYGIFMMDSMYTIQGAYSKALEKIFSVPELTGKNFLKLLGSSLKPGELEGLQDYFEMIFKRAYDEDMLASINPIDEFVYNAQTGEKKNLRCSFTLAEHGKGSSYLVATMEDITAEKELEKQLEEAENLRENEMRSLFQVIQLNPRVLKDFIDDAEYEFDRINDMLKGKKVHHEVIVEMYQHIHAIKSNALILNLENFAKILHDLEDSIREIREKDEGDVPFDDILSLVLELDEAMKEKDQLKLAVSKIDDFKRLSKEESMQERYVLVETLTQVCKKTQAALDKKVKFIVTSIDQAVLDYGPRRAIKEILTQLIRNAVCHGIESLEERESLGKNPEGVIRLSLKHKDKQIVIKLTDNGRGIDFGHIRQKAQASNLLVNPAKANDKGFLLKTIFSPGFSTQESVDFHAGRGIGLSLVKDRIKELRGNIMVSTAEGKGTIFTITIPMELQAHSNAS